MNRTAWSKARCFLVSSSVGARPISAGPSHPTFFWVERTNERFDFLQPSAQASTVR
jgi:hypothetical protein